MNHGHHGRRYQPHSSNLALHAARQDEVRDARRSIPISSSIVDEAYAEIKERDAFLHLDIETREDAETDDNHRHMN
ncbi:hypothetical protein [Methylocystis suflitae]|uniref:hypothetical protein n=1 Tax=Methylocystis suflitae TaxID=2951405 RepID=UPI002108D354|nr:hypothetical protein [Methylocystis suflitae]MCQ4188582.1 hypothetical protein [Methylocystis suflitae]